MVDKHFLHIHSDYVILESVDERNRPVPPGQMGSEVLLTNLSNYTLPLIRYEVSDIISISEEPCACGSSFPFIKEIGGRHDDLFYLRNVTGTFEAVNPMHFVGFLINLENVREGQIQQVSYEKILLILVANDSVKLNVPEIVRSLKDLLKTLNIDTNIDVDVEIHDAIPRDATSGKFKTIIRKVPVPEQFRSKQ